MSTSYQSSELPQGPAFTNAEAGAKIAAVANSAPDHAAGEKFAAASSATSQVAGAMVAAAGGVVGMAMFGAGVAGGHLGGGLAQMLGADQHVANALEHVGLRRIGQIDASKGPNPARLGDSVAHSFAAAGLLATLLIGALAAAATAALIVATGGAAAVVLIGAAAAGGFAGGFAGGALGSALAQMGSVTGKIALGSPNVFIEGKAVARMTDIALCAKEPAPVPLVEGSETVFINGLPMARVGHKLLCGAVVDQGAKSVFTDNTTQACARAAPDVPVWMRVAVDWLGFLPLGAACARTAKFAKTSTSKLVKGNQCSRKCTKEGDPVNVASGEFYEAREDVYVPGVLPIGWRRSYSSGLQAHNPSLFGPGWSDSFSICLRRTQAGNLEYWDEEGHCLVFSTPHEVLRAGHLHAPHLMLCGTQQQPQLLDMRSGITQHFAWCGDMARLSKVTDQSGNQFTLAYHNSHTDHTNQISEISHSDGYRLLFHYQGQQLHLSLQESGEAAQELVHYSFDDLGRLASCASEASGQTRYQYDAAHRLIAWQDASATQVQIHYNEQGRVAEVVTPGQILAARFAYQVLQDGSTITQVWAGSAQQPSIYYANARQLVTQHCNPIGQQTQCEWDENDNLRSETDQFGSVTQYRYDHEARLSQIIDGRGRVTRLHYDECSRLIRLNNPREQEQTWQYGAHGQLLKMRQLDGSSSEFIYGPSGQLTEIIEGGARTQFLYDLQGRPCGKKLPNGAQETWQQNRLGRLYRHDNALGHVTHYRYADQLTAPRKNSQHSANQIQLPNGDVLKFTYDQEGMLASSTDASGAQHRYQWGAFDLLESETDALGNLTRYEYDSHARLRQIRNPLGQTWRFERDSAGQLLRELDFNGRSTSYHYDAQGRLLQKHIGHSIQIDYQYDALERLISERSGEVVLHYAYDEWDRLHSAQRQCGTELECTTEFEYDAFDRLIASTQNGQRIAWKSTEQQRERVTPLGKERQQLDNLGQLESLHLASGEVFVQHNALGQEIARSNLNLFAKNVPSIVQAQKIAPHFHFEQSFDAAGQLAQQQLHLPDYLLAGNAPKQVLRQYQWQQGRLQSLHDPRFGDVHYQHDARAQVLQTSYSQASLREEKFAYNALGDMVGRDIAGAAAKIASSRDYAHGRIERQGACRYHYDDAGRLIEKIEQRPGYRPKRWRYEWDGFERLRSVQTPTGETWRYHYDAFGRRIRKYCSSARAKVPLGERQLQSESYLWDGANLAVQWKTYADGGSEAGTDALRSETLAWHYQPGSFTPLALVYQRNDNAQELLHIITDQLGSPREAVNQHGEIVWAAQNKTWGELNQRWDKPRSLRLPWQSQQAANENWLEIDLRQPNQWHDSETGLFYNYQRYYDPEIAHYISADPIGLAGGMRPYGYVENPLVGMDPLGLSGCAVSPGEALRAKYGHLTNEQRNSRLSNLAEANAHRRLQELEASIPGAHFLEKHGAQTTPQAQLARATTGANPTTGVVETNAKGKPKLPSAATRFLSHRDQLNTIQRAQSIYKVTGSKVLAEEPIKFDALIGEGYQKSSLSYAKSHSSQVFFVNGQVVTAFPKWGL